jgi:hypothetical protein
MRTIALEEHFASPGFLEGPGRDLKARAQQFGDRAAKLLELLCDVGDKRMAENGCCRNRCASLIADFSRQVIQNYWGVTISRWAIVV